MSFIPSCRLKSFDNWFKEWLITGLFVWLFDDHLEDRPDPDADVGRNNVHQTKTGKTLELLDVQLKKKHLQWLFKWNALYFFYFHDYYKVFFIIEHFHPQISSTHQHQDIFSTFYPEQKQSTLTLYPPDKRQNGKHFAALIIFPFSFYKYILQMHWKI